ncbi:MAG: hypothetical protein PHX21_05935 [bacterium]|nr:hypothetical protein [bacterium]
MIIYPQDEESINRKILSILENATRKSKAKRYKCFIPDCNEGAINSHSQSKNSLKNISENGHIITSISKSFYQYIRNPFHEIGINDASCFKGFCPQHDREYFNKADNIDVNSLNGKVLDELAFRTFAYEIRTKEYILEECRVVKKQVDRKLGNSRLIREKLEWYFANGVGVKNFLAVTYPFYMKKWEPFYKNKNCGIVKHIVFSFDKNIGLSTSTSIDLNPIIEEESIELQNLMCPRPFAFLNIVPREDLTIAALSYFPEQEKLVNELIKKSKSLVQIIFNYCEEILFKPSFFDSFPEDMKKEIKRGLSGWAFWKEIDFSTFSELSSFVLTSPQYIN